MRINTVFSKKVSTGQFENETYTVTVEAESEFNHIDQVADYLFAQARAAVDRQIKGTAVSTDPATMIPAVEQKTRPEPVQQQETPRTAPKQQEKPASTSNGNGSLLITEKQIGMARKLMGEVFDSKTEAARWLKQSTGAERVNDLSRKQASRTIESLMDMKRESA
ncbi:MAG: phage protein GemA/Gp16 family protein [bacterium]